ncbi:MAG TPA: energy transducer TonB [Chthonomonas sp.]|uniref:energy transducer TonB n=1 Tax=Chthonomonas sp. TaxID=2282153 RepID=UPI002B4B45CF|nr:energy transducer TonB [Chthonomonas sp.]HLH78779.1 energy transducer TonB [Chthonomonas sp.]
MRRRRRGNSLLTKTLIISILINVVLLPILAKFGAFKKVEGELIHVTMVQLPPPVQERQQPKAEKKQPKKLPPKHLENKKTHTNAHPQQPVHTHPSNLPKVIAASSTGSGSGNGGATVDNTGTGVAGQVPKPLTTPTPPPKPKPTPPPQPQPKQPTPPPTPQKPTEVAVAKPTPQPEPQPQPAPQPVFTLAEPALPLAEEPQPQIPDDLRYQPLDAMCVVEVTVEPDGTVASARIVQSSGHDTLDQLALEAARQWKFKPGTRNGVPVESTARLHFHFEVD